MPFSLLYHPPNWNRYWRFLLSNDAFLKNNWACFIWADSIPFAGCSPSPPQNLRSVDFIIISCLIYDYTLLRSFFSSNWWIMSNALLEGLQKRNASCYVIIGSLLLLLLKKNNTCIIYLFIFPFCFHFCFRKFLETLVSRACQSLSPWRHFYVLQLVFVLWFY